MFSQTDLNEILTAADLASLGKYEIGQYLVDLDDDTVHTAMVWVGGVCVGKLVGAPVSAKKRNRTAKIARHCNDEGVS